MTGIVRKTILGSLGILGAGVLIATLNSSAQAASANLGGQVPSACSTSTCCNCTTTKKATKKKKTTVTITQGATNTATGQYTFTVDINPNLSGSKSWKYKLQQLSVTNGIEHWTSIGTFRSQGSQETGTHSVGAGTYRVVVYGTSSCKGKTYSARFTEPPMAAQNTAVEGASTSTGAGQGAGNATGTTVTNIYITQTVPAVTPTATPSPSSTPVTPTNTQTVSGAPTSVTAVFRASLSAFVSWMQPTNTGGSQITLYRVIDLASGKSCQASAPATSCTVEGLTAGSSYSFVVAALNSTGWSAWSTSSNSILALTAATRPTSVVAIRTNGGATVTWRAPSSDGGSAITQYLVTASDANTCQTSGELTCTFTNLSNTVAYAFFVQALTSFGMSDVSADSNTLPAIVAPDPVTGLSAVVVGSSATVSWIASASNGGLGPIVYHVLIGGVEHTTTGTTLTFSSLSQGSYSATVWASNPVGDSPKVTSAGFLIS